jgi:hypothetical protein
VKSGKLLVVKPEIVRFHPKAPFGNLESQTGPEGNPLYGS